MNLIWWKPSGKGRFDKDAVKILPVSVNALAVSTM
jgi:hypothetical protein